MKPYPSITNIPADFLGRACIAFEKLDGSNLRFLWNRRRGWCQFGTRHRVFTATDADFGPAIPRFLESLAQPVEEAVLARHPRVEEFIVFCEYLGPHSFAGLHDPARLGVPDNQPMRLVPFDLNGVLVP